MRRIKGFKLFESGGEIDIDAVCSLYEDIKSIEYILEEKGITPSYRLRVQMLEIDWTRPNLISASQLPDFEQDYFKTMVKIASNWRRSMLLWIADFLGECHTDYDNYTIAYIPRILFEVVAYKTLTIGERNWDARNNIMCSENGESVMVNIVDYHNVFDNIIAIIKYENARFLTKRPLKVKLFAEIKP